MKIYCKFCKKELSKEFIEEQAHPECLKEINSSDTKVDLGGMLILKTEFDKIKCFMDNFKSTLIMEDNFNHIYFKKVENENEYSFYFGLKNDIINSLNINSSSIIS